MIDTYLKPALVYFYYSKSINHKGLNEMWGKEIKFWFCYNRVLVKCEFCHNWDLFDLKFCHTLFLIIVLMWFQLIFVLIKFSHSFGFVSIFVVTISVCHNLSFVTIWFFPIIGLSHFRLSPYCKISTLWFFFIWEGSQF